MNPIFFNAIDSLKIGMKFFIDQENETSNKHAILSIFHSIELLLKEYLYRINPILIYTNIDKIITSNSQTIGFEKMINRVQNFKADLPKEQLKILKEIQIRRNTIEHHQYTKEENDTYILGESLKFIIYFTNP
jgi:uncharacterized membrane protein